MQPGRTQLKEPGPYFRTLLAGYPIQIVAVGAGLLDLSRHQRQGTCIHVYWWYFTKWVEAYTIPNQEAVIAVATKLVDDFFCRFFVPEQLHSYQGHQFESGVLQEVCHLLKSRRHLTTRNQTAWWNVITEPYSAC